MISKLGLKPWVERPFELIHHAEIHYRRESDYDRRLAIISFDNSIEVSITTYLTLMRIPVKAASETDVKASTIPLRIRPAFR